MNISPQKVFSIKTHELLTRLFRIFARPNHLQHEKHSDIISVADGLSEQPRTGKEPDKGLYIQGGKMKLSRSTK